MNTLDTYRMFAKELFLEADDGPKDDEVIKYKDDNGDEQETTYGSAKNAEVGSPQRKEADKLKGGDSEKKKEEPAVNTKVGAGEYTRNGTDDTKVKTEPVKTEPVKKDKKKKDPNVGIGKKALGKMDQKQQDKFDDESKARKELKDLPQPERGIEAAKEGKVIVDKMKRLVSELKVLISQNVEAGDLDKNDIKTMESVGEDYDAVTKLNEEGASKPGHEKHEEWKAANKKMQSWNEPDASGNSRVSPQVKAVLGNGGVLEWDKFFSDTQEMNDAPPEGNPNAVKGNEKKKEPESDLDKLMSKDQETDWSKGQAKDSNKKGFLQKIKDKFTGDDDTDTKNDKEVDPATQTPEVDPNAETGKEVEPATTTTNQKVEPAATEPKVKPADDDSEKEDGEEKGPNDNKWDKLKASRTGKELDNEIIYNGRVYRRLSESKKKEKTFAEIVKENSKRFAKRK